jgi:transcriptional regulator with XRE-family HTH domain
LSDLGPIPAPCAFDHSSLYAKPVFDEYRALVGNLARRRKQIGLSQEDLGAAAGLADGHINKLEAFARTAQFPTLQLWANTLGMELTLAPAPIPPATLRAIERRKAPLMQKQKPKRLPMPNVESSCDARSTAN